MPIILFPLLKHTVILLTLLYASYIDLKFKNLATHRKIYIPLIFFAVISFIKFPWWVVLPSAMVAFALTYPLFKIKRFGLGGADVKIFTLLAACYPISFILIIFYSGLAACVFSVFLIYRVGAKTALMMKFPYIPFIAVGTILHTYFFAF